MELKRIRILPDDVVSQIAAGEVVERPASVIKELVENALDAGATDISIEVEGAGKRLIAVADNGQGIAPDELELAITRHATSKLSSAQDLFSIHTLGFRGEALASMASVSRLTITSRRPEELTGAYVRVEGGQVREIERYGGPAGTEVRVEDLFYNVPARLKFLKKDTTERQQMIALVTRYAMAYPETRFKLIMEGTRALQTSGRGDRREVLAQLYGVDVAKQMLEVQLVDGERRVQGFISPVALTRSNRKEITLFVNGRWVQDAALVTAVLRAYHTLIMVGRYPLVVLFVDLPPQEVDVNVHPAKAEVRFRDPDQVFSMVQRAVKRALLAYSPVPQVTRSFWPASSAYQGWSEPAWEMPGETRQEELAPEDGFDGDAVDIEGGDVPEGEVSATAQPGLDGASPLLRLVGQVGAAYLVAEGPDGLYLIDQHAAHERVLFERLMRQRDSGVPSQQLLHAETVQLTPHQSALLESQLNLLGKLGFQIEAFGPNTYLVRAVPAILADRDPAAAVRAVVEDFEEDETPLQGELEARIAARVCKRSAVKAGQILSTAEQQNLLRELEQCQSPRTCPHGRPTMIHLSVDLLERQFGRRGSR